MFVREEIFLNTSPADANFNIIGLAASFERLKDFILIFRYIACSPKEKMIQSVVTMKTFGDLITVGIG